MFWLVWGNKRKTIGVILYYLVGNKIMNCLWRWNQYDVETQHVLYLQPFLFLATFFSILREKF